MVEPAQVKAYAEADFDAPHSAFIDRLKSLIGNPYFNGSALDLGCGPGDISIRFAKAFPHCRIDAIDGSAPMIAYARSLIGPRTQHVRFFLGKLPLVTLPQQNYDIIYSNSLLHHLPNPGILWQTIQSYSVKGSRIVVMDLLRPDSIAQAKALVNTYAANEPKILQHDFYRSLLAAFTLQEIKDQLHQARLVYQIEQISDRHALIQGIAD